MTVTAVHKDTTTLTMSVETEFDASVDRVWDLWHDPRKLERWWGPPTYPATFVDHDLTPGGRVTYHMTGPEGDQPRGWWRVIEVDPPHRLAFEDGFADEEGNVDTELPTMLMRVDIRERSEGRSEMTITTVFPTLEAMEQILAMGAEEGMKSALEQIDDILAKEVTI